MINTTLIPLLICGWTFIPVNDDPFKDAETIGDLESRQVVIPEASMTEASAEAAIELYRQYLEQPDGDAEARIEALRRMGDLKMEVGQEAEFNQSAIDAQYEYHSDAIQLYEQLLQSENGYDKADLALYQLARAYEGVGEPDKVRHALDRLVSEYPDSKYIDEAQFRLGEILFFQKDYYQAGLAYSAVVEIGDSSPYYEQSLYKLGWSYFKQAEFDATVHTLLDLLNLQLAAADNAAGEASFDAMSRPERELVEDTIRALSLTFAYMDGPDTIDAYVERRGNKDPSYLLYTRLGELYLEKERYLDAAETFDGFAAHEPNHYNAPAMSMRSIAAYEEARFPMKVLEGKRAFVRAYGLDSDYWLFHKPDERPDVVEPLKASLTDLAQYDHAEAQRTGDPEAYARAAEWYRRYLDYFPTDPDSAQRSFLLGEVLMEMDQYEEANIYYLRAAYEYPGYEDAAESGYAALLASRAHHSTLEGAEAEIWYQQELYQAVKFVRVFPQHKQAAPVLADTAEGFFETSEIDEALVVAGQLLVASKAATARHRRVSWTVVGHGHFELEHYPRAEYAYLELRGMDDAGRVENDNALSAAEIEERIASSIYRQAEVAVAANDVDVAVMHYLRVEKVTPTASIAPQATFDGSVLLFNTERYAESIVVMLGFRETYPGHEYQNDVTRNLAISYRRTAQPLKAAVEYEAVAEFSRAEPEVRREALYTAAELYEEGIDIGEARRVWRVYVGDFPNPVGEAIEIRQHLADLALEQDDIADRNFWLVAIIETDAGAGEQRSQRTKTLAAAATLELAEPKRLAFNAVRLQMPLADALKVKKELMEEALRAYNQVAGYGIVEYITVATFRTAQLYHRLSIDLMVSERPPGLSADEEEQYEILLEEQAFPFEEKAIEVYEVNVARAAKGVYDDWVAQSYTQLANLMPARYAKYEKAEDNVGKLY